MNNANWIAHDQSPYSLPDGQPGVGASARVRVRIPSSLRPAQVRLAQLVGGEPLWTEMRALPDVEELQAGFSWLEGRLVNLTPVTRYMFSIYDEHDGVHLTTRGARRFTGPYRDWFQLLAEPHAPSWLPGRVFYQVFVDRFRNGDPTNDPQDGEWTYNGRPVIRRAWDELPTGPGNIFEHFGGDLDGITSSLDYLSELGVNALYLTPIFDSPSNHRYDTRDYLRVDPHLGGEPALRRLLDAAHARGFKVILDGVFNHTGNEEQHFLRAVQGIEPERSMFTFRADGMYEAYIGVKTLPKIDYSAPESLEAFIDGPGAPVREWLRFGADGWRLDVSQMMGVHGGDGGNLAIHRRLKAAARAENNQAYIFGERSYDAEDALRVSADGRDGEDGVMNYHGFYHPVLEWLAGRRLWGQEIKATAESAWEVMFETWRVLAPDKRLGQYNLVGSHDVPRLITTVKGDVRLALTALTALMAFPGTPGVYYGDEIGLGGDGDPHNRAPFPWDETRWNGGLRAGVKALISARRGCPALQTGSLVKLHASEHTMAFGRGSVGLDGQVDAAIAVLTSAPWDELTLNLNSLGLLEARFEDALSGESFQASGGQLRLAVSQPRLLTLKH